MNQVTTHQQPKPSLADYKLKELGHVPVRLWIDALNRGLSLLFAAAASGAASGSVWVGGAVFFALRFIGLKIEQYKGREPT